MKPTLLIPLILTTLSGTVGAEPRFPVYPEPALQRFVIEREVPGAGRMTPQQMREGSAKSNAVLNALGPEIQWVHSYVTGDKIYCVYTAPSEALIRLHAERSGFPAHRISRVEAVIDPTTATAAR
jgi:hypothetical protein